MKVGAFVLTIALLMTMCRSAEFGQLGIVDSGTQSVMTPKTGTTTPITFNIVNYAAVPFFAIGLTGLQLPSAQIYKILHDPHTVTQTTATVKWDVIEIVYRVQFRWMASSGKPIIPLEIVSINVLNSGVTIVPLPDNVPAWAAAGDTVIVTLAISGFHHDTKSATYQNLNVRVSPEATAAYNPATAGASPIDFSKNPDELKYVAAYSLPANPTHSTATLPKLIVAVIIALKTTTTSPASTPYIIGYDSTVVNGSPSLFDLSDASLNIIASATADYFCGASAISLGQPDSVPTATSMVLAYDIDIRDSKNGEVTSSTPGTFKSITPTTVLIDEAPPTCTPAISLSTALTHPAPTCKDAAGIALPAATDCKLGNAGADVEIKQSATANAITTTMIEGYTPIPVADAYQIKYTPAITGGSVVDIKVEVLDRLGNVIWTETSTSTTAVEDAFIANADQAPFKIRVTTKSSVANDPIKLTTFTIKQVTAGQIVDQSSNTCVNPENCPNLVYVDASDTFTCPACTDGKQYNTLTKTCSCPEGTYYDSTSKTCKFCTIVNCATCTTQPNQCTSCPPDRKLQGFACVCNVGLISLGSECGQCPTFCSTCSSQTVCTTCIATTTVAGTVVNTYRIRDATGKCVCDSTHYEKDQQLICLSCDPKCETCDATGKCSACKDPNVLDSTAPDCPCPAGKYYPATSTTGLCVACDISCATCNDAFPKCITCSGPTRQLNADGTCPCADGFAEYSPRVASCRLINSCGTSGCTSCVANKCASCDTTLGYAATPSIEGICVCGPGFFYNPTVTGRCTQCNDGCRQCDSTVCTACYAGITTPPSTGCTCPVGTYPDITTLTCKTCAVSNCKVCTATQCTECIAPRTPVAGVCACPNGFYSQGTSCVACPASCQLCNNNGCISCQSGNYIQPDGVSCASTCPAGYYILGTACAKCQLNCAACSGAAACSLCSVGALYQGICYSTCPARTFKSGSVCLPCDAACESCGPTANTCLKCASNLLVLYNGQCLASCPPNTVNSGGACKNCNNDCISCAPSIDICYRCQNNKYSNNGICVQTCPPGTFPIPQRMICSTSCLPEQYYDATQQACVACVAPCRTCTSPTTCTGCPATLILSQGTCISQCPPGTTSTMTANGIVCVICLPQCQTCSSPSVCASCPTGANLFQGRCIICQGATIFLNGQCVNCPIGCSSCTGSTPTSLVCTDCGGSGTLINGRCETCFSPCSTCGSGPNVCLSCIPGYNLVENTCSLTCPSTDLVPVNGVCRCRNNLVYYNSQCILRCPTGLGPTSDGSCASCPANCINCELNANVCTECALGYNLEAGRCGSANDCPYGQSRVDGVCTVLCATGKYLGQDGFCIGSCPAGTTLNSERTGCIVGAAGPTSPCPIGQYFAMNTCHLACPPTTYTPLTGYVCVACPTNCYECDKSKCLYCIPGFYLTSAGTCVASTACSPGLVSLGETCVGTCPAGTLNLNGFCTWACPSGTALYERWCYASCPSPLFRNGFVCVSACPANTIPIGGICTVGSLTNDPCPIGSFTNTANGQCQACSPPCASCSVTSTYCTSCIVGIPTNGVCRTTSAAVGANVLTGTVTNAFRAGTQAQIEVTLTRIPSLSPNAIANFFNVEFSPAIAAQVYQYKDQVQPKMNIFINFRSTPPASTIIILTPNADLLAAAYEQAGFTDLSGANLRYLLSNARTPNGF